MTGQSNDDWMNDPAPASYRPDPPPLSEEELREALARSTPFEVEFSAGDSGASNVSSGTTDGQHGSGNTDGGTRSAPGRSGGKKGRAKGEIYDDCPVTPLGVRSDVAYFLDALGQLRSVKKLEAQTIQSLFGHRIPSLLWNFPMWEKTDEGELRRKKGRFDQTAASLAMHTAAGECGVFDPQNSVRGVGAWTDDDGQLIYHMGDQVLIGSEMQKPGRIGKTIYPAYPPIPHPDQSDTAPDPVPEILRTFSTWNWTDQQAHPFIALGMVCAMMLSGALDWRPVFWMLAPAGSGKSEFQRLVKMLHGDDGLVQTTDATKSGITSKLGQSSLPVSVDELEPGDERSTKERDIIQLARVAASGGEWARGTADQTGVGGRVYSTFLFSSILIPGVMKSQDVQRLIKLELQPLPKGAAKLNLQPRTWRARGARLKALLIRRWPTWQERLGIWRHALELEGVTGRDADNWGTVLAMADMATQEDMPAEDVTSSWAKKAAFLAAADRTEARNDAEELLLHLMGKPFDVYRRGEQHTVAQWVMVAAALPGAPFGLAGDDGSTAIERAKNANAKLAKAGLRVDGTGEEARLFIANATIATLKELFRDSQWANGVWAQSAKRVPGAEPSPHPLTLAGIRTRGTFLPVRSIPGLTSFPMDRDTAEPPASIEGGADAGYSPNDWA